MWEVEKRLLVDEYVEAHDHNGQALRDLAVALAEPHS